MTLIGTSPTTRLDACQVDSPGSEYTNAATSNLSDSGPGGGNALMTGGNPKIDRRLL